MLVSDNEYLLGVLNSKVTQYLVQQSAAGRQGGFLEFKPMYISKIAIPEEPKSKTLPKLVKKLLSILKDDSSDEIFKIEAEIDARIAQLYGLTEEEYSIILSETDTSERFRTAALKAYRALA